MIFWLIVVAALSFAVLGILRLIFRPPSLAGRIRSRAIPATDGTALGRVVSLALHDGTDSDASGIWPLLDGRQAFAARVALIRAAEVSLDVQYYIWQRDATGLLLLAELQRAAERGVRVRLLLDDNGVSTLDADLMGLDSHPLIEVRLFNPFILRHGRYLGFLFDFARLNRRMHNKSLTADGAATIVGGRNIGDIYFSFGDGTHYIDTDVMGVGRIATDVGRDFDRYWASGSAYPVDRILPKAPGAWEALAAAAEGCAASPAGETYLADLPEAAPMVAALLAGTAQVERVPVVLISDHPAKGLGKAKRRQLLFTRLVALMGQPQQSLHLVSSYFVPGREFTRGLTRLAAEGRAVSVLTNSQQATDVLVVHSAYVRYRAKLLDAGVRLYELKAEAPPQRPTAAERKVKRRAVVGSSRTALHSKSLILDRSRVFVGSFNFDHRSLDLNTEMGVLVDSPSLAEEAIATFDLSAETASYQATRDAAGHIVWDDPGPPPRVHHVEPETTWASRAFLTVLGWLPIEWLL